MGLISWIKELISKMFKSTDIKKIINHDVVISDKMIQAIELWKNMYAGQAPWVDNDSVYSLRLEQSITKEFADISLNEMTSKVTNEKLDSIYKKATRDLNEKLQLGLALGSMIIKPLGSNKVEYVMADSFIPVEFDENGRLLKVVFVETRKVSDTSYYRRFEYHSLDDTGLTITNTAYHSNSESILGSQVPLGSVFGWEKLLESVNYPLMTRPAFGYYRNPLNNTVDGSACGVSIFDKAKYLIKQADVQYGRLNWEFESGERAVHVDITALRTETKTDGEKVRSVASLNKRLYRGMDLQAGEGKDLFDVFSPEFRDISILNGMQEHKRAIELCVGLAYGDISDPTYVAKTATEVKSAKKRKYNTVTSIQDKLKDCLEDLVYALAFYGGLTQTGYQFVCDFKDSILTDDETERKQDMQDVAMGAMQLWQYRAKWYSETEKQAKDNIVQEADVIE